MDRYFSKFSSRVVFQKKNSDYIENMRTLIKTAIEDFYKINNFVPQQIILMRDGLADSQMRALMTIEIPEILKAF